jgi:hypothetical protein
MRGLSGGSRRIAGGLCSQITAFQHEAKAIPQLSDMDRAEIDGPDRVDCDGTRFVGSETETKFTKSPVVTISYRKAMSNMPHSPLNK